MEAVTIRAKMKDERRREGGGAGEEAGRRALRVLDTSIETNTEVAHCTVIPLIIPSI